MVGGSVPKTNASGPSLSGFTPHSFGWQQNLPDYRDYIPSTPIVKELLSRLKRRSSRRPERPERVDLREFFPVASDQQHLNASPAHACVGIAEYFQRRALGKTERLSPLFLYKTTRKLLGASGDTGADLRTTLKAMVQFGVPAQRFWHSDVRNYDSDPEAHLYSLSNEFRRLTYVRLDARNAGGSETLEIVKSFLAAGFPIVFGFPVTSLVSDAADIPYRPEVDSVVGGQAAVAVGYDDRRFHVTRGSLLIRNSWGVGWGDRGYGWLPYGFVLEKLAVDFWTILQPNWLDSGEFSRPQLTE